MHPKWLSPNNFLKRQLNHDRTLIADILHIVRDVVETFRDFLNLHIFSCAAVVADEKQPSALIRRHEQIKRWENSDTYKEPTDPKETTRKVKFQDGCVFLAACSSGDRNEVKRLLDRGADINTANVDGLTALHQACIDDNLDMVEFLVDNGADVNACDNEGWTALHATASCGFTEIASYLLRDSAIVCDDSVRLKRQKVSSFLKEIYRRKGCGV